MSIRVLIADGAKIVRDAIRRLLNGLREIEIVGEAADFAQAIGMIEELKPQIVILDLYMPIGSESSLDDVRDQVRSSGVQVLAISIYLDETTQELAKAIGAPFFVDKMKLGHELIPAVKTLASRSSEEQPGLKQE